MKPDDLDRELKRLQDANERVGANLVELEIDSSRQLLEAAPLTGESAARWSASSAALTDLWQWRGLLEKLLERAEELRRSPRRASELESLISGPSIELAQAQVPLAERFLLGTSEVTVRCTADELLARMSQAFDEVKSVVARFGQARDTLTPRLTAARGVFDQARALADSLGESGRADLEGAGDWLTRLTGTLTADPLSVEPKDVDRLSESLEAIRREFEAANALRGELDTRVADARRLLTELQGVVDEGRAAHEELVMKIATPSAPPTLDLPSNPEGELDQIAAVARAGAWRDAHRRLVRWTADTRALLEEAQRILRANRAPIEARNQLRALLEAYQVKAGRLGRIEDTELERIFSQAHGALHTAPTDVALAAQLVRRYQELLNAARPAAEEALR